MRVMGILSGTSLDGIDVCLLRVEGIDPEELQWELEAFSTRPYASDQRALIQRVMERGGAAHLCRLHGLLGEWMAGAVLEVLEAAAVEPEEVEALGSHGQTIWHLPPGSTEADERGFTLQLGDPATLAERTGIPVVSDFRSRDVAAGGHGAPLVPWADRILLSRPGRSRALQNLGGMGNVTWLPPRGSGEEIVAFDTGPGVALLDAAAHRATGGRWNWDQDGTLAAGGAVDPALLRRLLDDPFFRQPPPRSTGRERFGPSLVDRLAAERGLRNGRDEKGWRDLLATLTALTAAGVADACTRWLAPRPVDEVVLSGGGSRNPTLVKAIRDALDPIPVLTGPDALGIDPDAREAAAFALLAWAHLRGIPGNEPAATGAQGRRVLGSLTPGREGRRR